VGKRAMTSGRPRRRPSGPAKTRLFIPPRNFEFQLVDAMGDELPSTRIPRLLMLVSGRLRGHEHVLRRLRPCCGASDIDFSAMGDAMLVMADEDLSQRGHFREDPSSRSSQPTVRPRLGRLTLTHGVVETPAFMPVGDVRDREGP